MLWPLPFFMAVATYCYYEKVRRTICTAIVSHPVKGGDGEFIEVDRYGTQLSNMQKTGSISFTRISLKKAVKYLLDICYNLSWVIRCLDK